MGYAVPIVTVPYLKQQLAQLALPSLGDKSLFGVQYMCSFDGILCLWLGLDTSSIMHLGNLCLLIYEFSFITSIV